MTEKQKRFAEEYVVDCNGSQAAIRAGYSKDTARVQASKMLTKPNIKKYINELLEKKKSESIATAEEVLQYLTSVIRGETESEEIITVGIGEGMSEVQHISKKPNEKERLKAAELLGKRYGIYTDKVEETVDMDLTVSIDYGDEEGEQNEIDS